MQTTRIILSNVLVLADGLTPDKRVELNLYLCEDGFFRIAQWTPGALLPSLQGPVDGPLGMARGREMGEAAFDLLLTLFFDLGYRLSDDLPLFLALPWLAPVDEIFASPGILRGTPCIQARLALPGASTVIES